MKKTTGYAHLSEIEVGERFRKNYTGIAELATDIKEKGLIQPLAVEDIDGKYHLLAGGRRYKALATIPEYAKDERRIELRIYHNLDPYVRRAIELAENVNRQDMTWDEEVSLRAEIHELFCKQQGGNLNATGRKQRMADTAAFLGVSTATLSQDIEMAKNLKRFPSLRKAETKRAATNTLSGLKKTINRATAVKAARKKLANLTPNSEPAANNELASKKSIIDSFVVDDFFSFQDKLPRSYFDLIEVDYDYGIDYVETKKRKTTTKNDADRYYTEVEKEDYPEKIREIAKLTWEMANPDSWLVFWFGMRWYQTIVETFTTQGWNVIPIPVIWKKNGGANQAPKSRLTVVHEQFLYMQKGAPELAKFGQAFLDFPTIPYSVRAHITPKPVKLYQEIIELFTFPKANILSPFVGSGAMIHATSNAGEGRQIIGVDMAQENKDEFTARTMAQSIGKFDNYEDIYNAKK